MKRLPPANWKSWTLIILIPASIGFFSGKVYCVRRSRPPSWLQTRTIVAPRVATGSRPGLPVDQFRVLVDLAQGEPHQSLDLSGSVEMYEVFRDSLDVIIWRVERYVNQGFAPQTRFECSLEVAEKDFLGYYAMDGTPLPTILRKPPPSTKGPPALEIQVATPVPPGGELLVIRRARRSRAVSTWLNGTRLLSSKQLPEAGAGRRSRAVLLPAGASLVDYKPKSGSVISAGNAPLVRWDNSTLISTDPVLSVEFTIPP